MTSYVTSIDGTAIALDRLGDGSPLVVIGGLLCDRGTTRPLAEQLAIRFSVINYDRRGRGSSGNTLPYTVEREIEDLAALIPAVGGEAAVYGHSSGAGLALRAAADGLPITRLVLHEPPYGPDDEHSRQEARQLAEAVRAAVEGEDRARAIELFFTAAGMPTDMIEGMSQDPSLQALAATMPYDFEVMGDFDGGTIPEAHVRRITLPTLVLSGGNSPEFFTSTAVRIAELLPRGDHHVLRGQDHAAAAEAVAPVITEFLTGSPLTAS
jgi:pimeloyl-ACP methyl ester carboxylesterase